ncbi:MAG: glycine--tRNA ligase subunit beta [Alphaproteobacteria bacterium]|nr:MAG: glycine--tRNA ligase subunit beta [Alphaproteobacteria bacterium]
MPELLLELFSEEIPARMQPRARDDLKRLVTDGLVEAGLTYASAGAFSTPRRLSLVVEELSAESPAVREERKGPSVDAPEKAIEGFLRSTGLRKDQLEVRETRKGKAYFAVIERPGRKADDIVAEVVDKVVRTFPWPKSMRWGTGNLRWVRPLHAILLILSDEAGARTVPLEIEGIRAGNQSRGHRFMAPEPFEVTGFADYAQKLRAAKVILDPAERARHIQADAEELAFARGLELVSDEALLQEITGLVEWPVPLLGDIAPEFLELPPEVLQTSMREHQKFFSVRNPATGRIEAFVTVANRETEDRGATILAGNRKVLAARLSDARFFWENDLRIAHQGLGPWLEALEQVTFQRQLGSQGDRARRISALARELAPVVGAEPDMAAEAGLYAKADLASEMVYEFPELQGTMGRYYLAAAGKPPEVALAAEEHYRPLGPTDSVPTAPVSVAVALADKLDLLAGFWAIDEKPTGSKDPFALRRAALGVIRIILQNGIRMKLRPWLASQILRHELALSLDTDEERRAYLLSRLVDEIAAHGVIGAAIRAVAARLAGGEGPDGIGEVAGSWLSAVEARVPEVVEDLVRFFHDRLKVHLRAEGIRHDVIDACLAMPDDDDLVLVVARARALSRFLESDDGENLLQGFKRANNILVQAEERDGVEYSFGPDPKFAETEEERALFAALDRAESEIGPALAAEDFEAAMRAMAALRGPIDAFFEAVQVNTDNEVVRRNRLNLLNRIRDICLSVADLRLVEG